MPGKKRKLFSLRRAPRITSKKKFKREDEDDRDDDSDAESDHDDCCAVCGLDGEVLCCDTCSGVYHLYCLDPPLAYVPKGEWFCPKCPGAMEDEATQTVSTSRAKSRGKPETSKTTPIPDIKTRLRHKKEESPPTSNRVSPRSSRRMEDKEKGQKQDQRSKQPRIPVRAEGGGRSNKVGENKLQKPTLRDSSSGDSEDTIDSDDLETKIPSRNQTKHSLPIKPTLDHSGDTKSLSFLSSLVKNEKLLSSNNNNKNNNNYSSEQFEGITSPLVPINNLPVTNLRNRRSSSYPSSSLSLLNEDTSRSLFPSEKISNQQSKLNAISEKPRRSMRNVGRPRKPSSSKEDAIFQVLQGFNSESDEEYLQEAEDDDDDEEVEDEEDDTNQDNNVPNLNVRKTVSGGKEETQNEGDDEDDEQSSDTEINPDRFEDYVMEDTTKHSKGSEKVFTACVYNDQQFKTETIEKILAWKPNHDFPTDESKTFFLVKWEGRPYRMCTWVPKSVLHLKNKQKLKVFERMDYDMVESNNLADIIDTQYLKFNRIIAKTTKKDKTYYLLKWKGLGYDQCTWESSNIAEENPELLRQFEEFNDESRCNFKKCRKKPIPYSTQPDCITGGTLHDYQIEGVNWLLGSWFNKRNVILADEMGLGKTVQIIAFIAALYKVYTRGPILIVTPSSVLRNWGREFAKWAPQINVIRYIGCKKSRSIIRKHEFFFKDSAHHLKKNRRVLKFDVLLTSYDMVLQDENILNKYKWEMLIIDEAQRLKNRQSKLLQTFQGFIVKYKILLTGTPLQNNLKELFVLLNFIDHDTFESLNDFLNQCSNIQNDEQISNIHKLITPYVLRRLKSQVLQNLPSKNDYIVRVDMTDLQKNYYRAILQKNFQFLKKNIQTSNIHIELLKCCNHPYLIEPDKEDESQPSEKSLELLVNSCGKLKLLDTLLDRLKERGHRVLIFSKMTKMLDIFEDYLFYKNFKFERLDGSTSSDERQVKIDRFNAPDSESFCFLLSTRAGGLGINLATADTVIIYDCDWNPHNDIQALSRSHRLGQEKPVMVYRLVTRGTIEERIVQISKHKLMIEHLVFEKMNAKGETILKKGELDDILRFGVKELFDEEDSRPAIVYDEAAIEKLLDRSEESLQEKEEYQNDYLNSFKVAPYKTEENSSSFWDLVFNSSAIKKQPSYEEYGRGKRRTSQKKSYNLNTTNYTKTSPTGTGRRSNTQRKIDEDDMSDEQLSDSDMEMEKDDLEVDIPEEEEDEDEDMDTEEYESRKNKRPLLETLSRDDPLIEGKGKELKVNGFSLVQRSAVLKLVMAFGMKDGGFTHLAQKKFGFLRAKSDFELQEYSKLVLKHILEPTNSNYTYEDGIPKDRNFPLKDILYRVVSIHLISRKIANTKDHKSLNINDRRWTELHRLWSEPNQIWTKEHDFKLLVGTLKHGYGKWGEILQDSEIGLFAPSQLAIGRKVSAPSNPPPSLFHQLCKAAKGSDDDSEDEAEKIANIAAPFQYKPDNVVSRFLKRRLQVLENALFVEFQFSYPHLQAALTPTAEELSLDSTIPAEDEGAKRFMEKFKELYNRAHQLLDNAKRLSSSPFASNNNRSYKEEIERHKKALVKLDNLAMESRSLLSKVKTSI